MPTRKILFASCDLNASKAKLQQHEQHQTARCGSSRMLTVRRMCVGLVYESRRGGSKRTCSQEVTGSEGPRIGQCNKTLDVCFSLRARDNFLPLTYFSSKISQKVLEKSLIAETAFFPALLWKSAQPPS